MSLYNYVHRGTTERSFNPVLQEKSSRTIDNYTPMNDSRQKMTTSSAQIVNQQPIKSQLTGESNLEFGSPPPMIIQQPQRPRIFAQATAPIVQSNFEQNDRQSGTGRSKLDFSTQTDEKRVSEALSQKQDFYTSNTHKSDLKYHIQPHMTRIFDSKPLMYSYYDGGQLGQSGQEQLIDSHVIKSAKIAPVDPALAQRSYMGGSKSIQIYSQSQPMRPTPQNSQSVSNYQGGDDYITIQSDPLREAAKRSTQQSAFGMADTTRSNDLRQSLSVKRANLKEESNYNLKFLKPKIDIKEHNSVRHEIFEPIKRKSDAELPKSDILRAPTFGPGHRIIVNADLPSEIPVQEATPTKNNPKIDEIRKQIDDLKEKVSEAQIEPARLQKIKDLMNQQNTDVKRLSDIESHLSDVKVKLTSLNSAQIANEAIVNSQMQNLKTRQVQAAELPDGVKPGEYKPLVEVLPAVTRPSAQRTVHSQQVDFEGRLSNYSKDNRSYSGQPRKTSVEKIVRASKERMNEVLKGPHIYAVNSTQPDTAQYSQYASNGVRRTSYDELTRGPQPSRHVNSSIGIYQPQQTVPIKYDNFFDV